MLSLLVLVARVHESLVLVSLSDILLHRVRYDLINSRGVPFGLLTAPFQLMSVRFLASQPFLASLRGLFSKGWDNPMLGTVAVTVTSILLAILTGMSSTILILPKQAWVQVSADSSWTIIPDNTTETVYATTSMNQLYPTEFTEASIPQGCSEYPAYNGNAKYNYTSGPFMGFNSLYQLMPSVMGKSLMTPSPISKVQNAWQSISIGYMGSSYTWDLGDSNYLAGPNVYSTSPMDLVAYSLFRKTYFWTQAKNSIPMKIQTMARDQNGLQGWKQPRVSIRCSSLLKLDSRGDSDSGTDSTYVFNGGNCLPFNLTLDQVALAQIDNSPDAPRLGVTFLDLQHLVPFPISAAFITQDYNPAVSIDRQLCLIEARWVRADAWISWPVQQDVQTDISVHPQAIPNGTGCGVDDNDLIRLDTTYIDALNIRHNLTSVPVLDMRYISIDTDGTSGSPTTAKAFDTLGQFCRSALNGFQLYQPAICPALQYSLYFTDALARHWSNLKCMGWQSDTSGMTKYFCDSGGSFTRSSMLDLVHERGYTEMEMLYFQNVYMYRLGATTLCLAMADTFQ
ncbi:hypothetical protein BR93DRAFT_990648 [Coniochaeta sp. PMI_546]|nr:hypothetical protein BR93DRAFT_990648 [Coniochaeta sp. PMI_546]